MSGATPCESENAIASVIQNTILVPSDVPTTERVRVVSIDPAYCLAVAIKKAVTINDEDSGCPTPIVDPFGHVSSDHRFGMRLIVEIISDRVLTAIEISVCQGSVADSSVGHTET
jgi:hypothetical protein